jgi:hypothetical protein
MADSSSTPIGEVIRAASSTSPSNRQISAGRHTRRNRVKSTSETMPPPTSTSVGPKKFEVRYCTKAKLLPETTTAGHTPQSPFQPDMAATIHAGMMSENSGNCRPTIWLSCISGNPVTSASVWMGVPNAPNATGAVLAISASPAASNGRNPAPIISAAEMATGVPKPAAPSRNAPKL